ncbi:hypothetical protein FRC03_009249 [Tulasnella sp. 419]|nr:hypothetical protein FRC03_009249 [Tulasnella sp. 419]
MAFTVIPHILEPNSTSGNPYYVTAKQYIPTYTKSSAENDEDAVTIIAAHATGAHKEQFELTFGRLFEQLAECGGVKIKEAWSIDAPNHGEAAVFNQEYVDTHFPEAFPWDEYSRAISYFLRAGPSSSAKVDFTKRNLCGIGHSMGGVSLIYMQQSPDIPIKFNSLILLEPMLMPPGVDIRRVNKIFIPSAYQRRDVWPSKEAALQEFKAGKGYKTWDPEMLELFVQYGLRTHPAVNFKVSPYKGVCLACTRNQEAACYRGSQALPSTMMKALGPVSRKIPVHIIWGNVEDSLPRMAKEGLVDESMSGIKCASVGWVPNAGHLVLQHSPSGVADAIAAALKTSGQSVKSKL